VINGGDGGTSTEPKAMSFKLPDGGVKVFRSPGHQENFFACIRTREKPIMPVEAGVKVATPNNMGNIAYILGRKLTWDPAKERFAGDDEANKLLYRPARAPFTFPDPI
jgi:hypothetical protein